MPAFIQITDTHIVTPPALAYGHSDTAKALETAIATINAKLPVLGDVRCAIVTGDLTDHGTVQEYDIFTSLMSRLDLPWLAIPGNHDRRDALRTGLPDNPWLTKRGDVQWHHDLGAFSVIGLDTLVEGAPYGALSEEGFAFLDRALTEIGDQPAVIATHHPWMHSGIAAMDAANLRNGAQLIQRLEAHGGHVQMISGHVHRALRTQIGRIPCQISPATCHAVDIDHRRGVEDQLVLEPGGFTVHTWLEAPAPCLVSDVVPIGTFPGPWAFRG